MERHACNHSPKPLLPRPRFGARPDAVFQCRLRGQELGQEEELKEGRQKVVRRCLECMFDGVHAPETKALSTVTYLGKGSERGGRRGG